jgi:hypothetical protein
MSKPLHFEIRNHLEMPDVVRHHCIAQIQDGYAIMRSGSDSDAPSLLFGVKPARFAREVDRNGINRNISDKIVQELPAAGPFGLFSRPDAVAPVP